ncbi:hypothetical protein DFJ77DRAFT_456075 [Powellomyces hirtus]|nr:hypothetical protein DFJ77DRAFT_456075 [Powellomyces hirtus]
MEAASCELQERARVEGDLREALKAKTEQCQAGLRESQARAGDVDRLQHELRHVKQKHDEDLHLLRMSLDNKDAELQTALQNSRESLAKAEEVERELRELNGELKSALESARTELLGNGQKLEVALRDAREAAAAAENRQAELENARSALRKEEQERIDAVDIAKQLTDKLSQELDEKAAAFDAALRELVTLRAAVDEARNDLSQAKSTAANETRLKEHLVAQIEELRSAKEAAIAATRDELTRLKSLAMEKQNALSVVELKMANELATKDVQLRKLQDELRQKATENSDIKSEAKAAVSKARKEAEKAREELSKKTGDITRLAGLEKRLHAAEKEREKERSEFAQRFANAETEMNDALQQLDSVTIQLEDEQRRRTEMEDNYQLQLDLLQNRGIIKESEVKKLGELNAELFGHANAKQKIKHVAQLKEENVKLKTDNFALSRRCDEFKRKLMNLEREVESYRGLGSFGGGSHGNGANRKLSRVARSALSTRQSSVNSIVQTSIVENTEEEVFVGDKENTDIDFTAGGLSFVV